LLPFCTFFLYTQLSYGLEPVNSLHIYHKFHDISIPLAKFDHCIETLDAFFKAFRFKTSQARGDDSTAYPAFVDSAAWPDFPAHVLRKIHLMGNRIFPGGKKGSEPP